ncbi:MAG: hypothetical protein LBQ88_10840 [Treponema sp.]|jgi:hypothetical protein|nr:hypothetical protein [Treponema sp.]
MSARFVTIDWGTPLLFPEDLRKWATENHIVHFIIEAVREVPAAITVRRILVYACQAFSGMNPAFR